MRERQILPLVVVALTGALVAVVALWTLDRVDSSQGDLTQNDALGLQSAPKVIEWKLVTTWPKGLPGLGAAPENFARRVNEASGGPASHQSLWCRRNRTRFRGVRRCVAGCRRSRARRFLLLEGQIPAAVFLRLCRSA